MQYRATILSNTEVSPGYFRMRLHIPHGAAAAHPGQFLMVRVRDAIDPLLRRPFGIFDMGAAQAEFAEGEEQACLDILYKVVGKGTRLLSALHHGDPLDVVGPLGKGFATGDAGGEQILVGGGVGLAPLYYLARTLVKDTRVRLFAGGRTREDILCITEFERLGVETYVATDDGTLGERGLVTEVMKRHVQGAPAACTIFACGPFPMLKAVALIARQEQIPCQVSLEAYMACGVGACLGCVIKGRNHSEETPDYRCVCKDGPVFDSRELLWD
ncbi:MAG TPA: dihydroorotate dehydrogenase electron transfer subunit [Geobacteraceae bacterium]